MRDKEKNWDEDRSNRLLQKNLNVFNSLRKQPISEIYPILFKLHNFACKIVTLLETIISWQIENEIQKMSLNMDWTNFPDTEGCIHVYFLILSKLHKPDGEARSSPNIAQHIISHSKGLSLRKNVLQTGYIY